MAVVRACEPALGQRAAAWPSRQGVPWADPSAESSEVILASTLKQEPFWQEHESSAHSEQCSRNNGTRRQRASSVNLRLCAVMCVSLHFWRVSLRFGKNTKSRAHSEQCSRNNNTRSQRAIGVNLQLFAVMCVSLHFWQELWQEHLAKTRKQSTQRAVQPQQRHTKSMGQQRESATLCGNVRIIAFWQEHLARTFGKNTKK